MSGHVIRKDRIICGNCGIQLKPDPIKEEGSCMPLEEIVDVDDRIRQLQYQAARAGIECRHSVMIAANFSVGYRGAK